MSWGRFYVFVSGQRKTARRVLLHGAADVPWIEDSGEDRRSCELRYTIQAAPEAPDAPGAEEEKEEDAGLGALFDDSPDSEPGSPDLMSAAWVERMARDPVFQEMIALAETGEPVSDIASWLERLDLAERRQLIYVGARREEAEQVIEEAEVRADALRAEVAEAERRRDAAEASRAEAHRRIVEQHANDQFPAGG